MLKNRDLFLRDPAATIIPNLGVAKVVEPRQPEEWAVLRWELERFVCEGEYERGLQRILSSFLGSLSNPQQPAVWISGFYGSGKSHLVKVLEYLWRDVEFPDGARARDLVKLPAEIKALFVELATAGKRAGGLWSAAGTLGAGAGDSVRLALLSILFRSAGLPERYAPASFVIWLRQEGYYDGVKAAVESRDRRLDREIENMYVSPVLAEALLQVAPGLADSPAGLRQLLKTQFPLRDDVSDDELVRTMADVLELRSVVPGKLPCTLVAMDEVQQFIGEDSNRSRDVQNVVEACSARFGSQLLFVATGQAALQDTPQLQRLQGRFTVRVMLADSDVEEVVREVVLRKAPDKMPPLQAMLNQVSGEIDRHLLGTKLGAVAADADYLLSDYPLLPVRRRFWEAVLRAVDVAGMASQLRTQLRIVHETTKEIAAQPVGWVIAGDAIYDQLKADMLISGILLREVAQIVADQDDGTPDGRLRARLCATIFLIGKLPTEGPADSGLRATASTLADLLVEDLTAGSGALRQRIPALLTALVEAGTLMLVGEEYRLQTRESAEWEAAYRKRYVQLTADDSRIASDRADELRKAVNAALKGISLTQGDSKTPRKHEPYFGADPPPTNTTAVPVWVRDEWSVSEKTVRQEAQAAGVDNPTVFVFLPKRDPDGLKTALARRGAAEETVFKRSALVSTPEGVEAKKAMESRLELERKSVDTLIKNVLGGARVFQGGSNEVGGDTLAAAVKAAVEASLVRLFPKFAVADHPSWGKVVERAGQGAGDALSAVGYKGDVDSHPVCREVRAFLGGAGKKGGDVRKQFMGAGYGWPQDAVDGAALALVAGGFVRAVLSGQTLTAKEITRAQLGSIEFYSEGVTVSALQRIGVRQLLADAGIQYATNEEAKAIPALLQKLLDLAGSAGGEPPLPEHPSTATIKQLQALSGNEQFVAVFDRRDQLLADFKAWRKAKGQSEERLPQWRVLQRLLKHASALPVAAQVASQAEAIETQRALLVEPDPLSPLLDELAGALRSALQDARQQLVEVRDREVASLEAAPEWRRLRPEQREQLIVNHGLRPVPELGVGTIEALLATLDATPLADWPEKAEALPGRAAKAREAAAKLLEPKAVKVVVPKATLRSVDDVNAYLNLLRAEIMKYVGADTPVII